MVEDVYLHDEEGWPAHNTTKKHNGAGDPVLIGGAVGGCMVAAAVRVPQNVDDGAFK